MPKALVTGGTGFIGAAIVRELLARGEQVKVLNRLTSPMGNLEGLDVETVDGDLKAPDSLKAALQGCDRLYHCAGLFALEMGFDAFVKANAVGTRNMLQAAYDARIERVVYTSTNGAVGSERRGVKTTEDTVWNFGGFHNPYITSKFVAEYEAMRIAARGLPVVTVNPTAPVGEGDIKPTPSGFFIWLICSGWLPLLVPAPFPIVDIRDVGRCHALAMEKGKPGERYLCHGETLTLGQIARLLREAVGTRAPWSLPRWMLWLMAGGTYLAPQFMTQFVGVSRFVLKAHDYDNSKSVRELGMTFSPLKGALERAARYFESRGWLKLRKPAANESNATK